MNRTLRGISATPIPRLMNSRIVENYRIAQWAPLTMEGRSDDGEAIAAARNLRGTDVDFGALTRGLLDIVSKQAHNDVRTNHEVTGLRNTEVGWTVSGKTASPATASGTASRPARPFSINAKHVFVGAGGFALKLLQKSGIPEVRGYAVLPVGASFYRSATPGVVSRHDAKVYGQADVGAPPMSVPHLDKRIIDGEEHLLFGPYATFSTKLFKHGHLSDFFTTPRPDNLHVIAAPHQEPRPLCRSCSTCCARLSLLSGSAAGKTS